MTTLYDTRGEEIRLSSTIIYAVKHSNFIHMTEGVVVGFREQQGYGYGYPRHLIKVRRTHDGKAVEIYKTDTVVVVSPRLMVPEGAMLARVTLEDGVRRSEARHILNGTHVLVGLEEILLQHTFPYLVGEVVGKHLIKFG
jgi:hypothetical protein